MLSHKHHEGGQHTLRLLAPKCAAHAQAGQFIHLQCDPLLPLRRPFSIMRSDPGQNSIDLLYKDVGHGTHLLAGRRTGEAVSVLGPVGNTFQLSGQRPTRLLIGGGIGIPPLIFLAETLARQFPEDPQDTLVLMGSEVPFPFDLTQSSTHVRGISRETNAALADMEAFGIASRLSSLRGYNGCYQGYVADLAKQYLETLTTAQRSHVEIFACGPISMLASVKRLAKAFSVDCQVSLEETMACAVGGCAGCVVEVNLPTGNTMQRICVDGPVFDVHTTNF